MSVFLQLNTAPKEKVRGKVEKYFLRDNNLILDNVNREYVLKVKDLPEDERPREKLLAHGPGSLSSSELLAVVLGTGTRKEGVLAITSRILREYGEKTLVNQKDPQVIENSLGIPLTKACQVVACFEIGRRYFGRTNGSQRIIRTSKQAFEYLKDMAVLPKEHLRGIYLNSHYCLVHEEVVSVGSLTANIIHPREVFRPALEYQAVAVIIAHNHPSGDSCPTKADIEVTEQMVKAGRILGIELLDHLVIGKDSYASVPINYH